MRTFKNDYNFGVKKELEVLKIIKDYFKDEIVKIENKYSKYDFKGIKYYYELKSRLVSYSEYPTTMIPINKITDNEIIFLFSFIDGLYYIEYDKELFSKFKIDVFRRSSRPDIQTFEQKYIYIPIEKLKIIHNNQNN